VKLTLTLPCGSAALLETSAVNVIRQMLRLKINQSPTKGGL